MPQPKRAHPRTSQFARLLLSEWRRLKLPVTTEPVIIAVSGGADSTALLLAINELKDRNKLNIEPYVAHLDHRLRKNSSKDARWVSALANQFGYQAVIGRAPVADVAKANSDNLEQVARRLRYNFLERTAKRKG